MDGVYVPAVEVARVSGEEDRVELRRAAIGRLLAEVEDQVVAHSLQNLDRAAELLVVAAGRHGPCRMVVLFITQQNNLAKLELYMEGSRVGSKEKVS